MWNERSFESMRLRRFSARRERVLAAAARVFARHGYDRASMRQVAAADGGSLSGLYHYASCKEEMLYRIQQGAFQALIDSLRPRLARARSPEEALREAVDNHLAYFLDNMDALKVCAQELDTLSGRFYAQVLDLRRAYFRLVHGIVERLAGPQVDPWLATANLFGMLNWFYQWHHRALKRERLVRQTVTLFLKGVRP